MRAARTGPQCEGPGWGTEGEGVRDEDWGRRGWRGVFCRQAWKGIVVYREVLWSVERYIIV